MDRMYRGKTDHLILKYVRICGKCGHEEPYKGDDQKCGACSTGVPFTVTKTGAK